MKIPEYPIKRVERPSTKKVEQASNVPIIDIIRHGETDYKQRRKTSGESIMNIGSPDFQLDSEHLDLTDAGIKTIKETAHQLLGLINKEKEVVLIISSPSDRAHSSALVLENELRDKGISLLNSRREIRFTEALNSADANLPKMYDKYDYDTEYGKERTEAENQDIDFIRQKRHEFEALNFQRFLRHINNIYKYLSPDTLTLIKGKRLRVVCFAHAEVTNDFIPESHGFPRHEHAGDYQQRGQILEIKPQSQLNKRKNSRTSVDLYSDREGGFSVKPNLVSRSFRPRSETKHNNYDKVLYSKLADFKGRRCKIILKDGDQPEGSLNHVDIGIDGKPYIVLDMGDARISAQYNLKFDNIADVVEIQ